MNDILKILFVENPYLAEQVHTFCRTLPEFCQSERDFESASNQIAEKLGRELYFEFEDAQSQYMARLVNAYYLFGLALRQEVMAALNA